MTEETLRVPTERTPSGGWIARMPQIPPAEGASEEEALAALACMAAALAEQLEDMIDNRLADEALADPDAVAIPWDEAKAWLDRNQPKE